MRAMPAKPTQHAPAYSYRCEMTFSTPAGDAMNVHDFYPGDGNGSTIIGTHLNLMNRFVSAWKENIAPMICTQYALIHVKVFNYDAVGLQNVFAGAELDLVAPGTFVGQPAPPNIAARIKKTLSPGTVGAGYTFSLGHPASVISDAGRWNPAQVVGIGNGWNNFLQDLAQPPSVQSTGPIGGPVVVGGREEFPAKLIVAQRGAEVPPPAIGTKVPIYVESMSCKPVIASLRSRLTR
jgi:hypothetical protein